MGKHHQLPSRRWQPGSLTVNARTCPSTTLPSQSQLSALRSLALRSFLRLAWVVALEGVLLVAAVMYVRVGVLPDTTRIFSYAVVVAGILMSWRFRRSRLLFALLVLALADRALVYLATRKRG